MNREILFRGRGIDDGTEFAGRWLRGDRLIIGGKVYIHPQSNTTKVEGHLTRLLAVHEVDPDTVGQYTGLKDKNGVKIFEGDIISYSKSKEIVYFDISLRIPCFTTGIGAGSSTVPHPYKISKRHAVVGNIYDDPELLEARNDQ